MQTPLSESIRQLYNCFLRYPLKAKIEGCPHCNLGNSESALHNKSLNDLTWDDLGVYPFKAMTTFGDVDDFKHFLPRILELLATDFFNAHYDTELILGKLNYGKWAEWPPEEQAAIRQFLDRWFRTFTSDSDDDRDAYEEAKNALVKLGFTPGGIISSPKV